MKASTEKAKERIWEIDALRGWLILSVLCHHIYLTVQAFCINGRYQIDPEWWIRASDPLGVWYRHDALGQIVPTAWVQFLFTYCSHPAVDTFFLLSGMASLFSRNNLKRSLKVLGAGAFVAAFTYGLSLWTGDPSRFIRFGVLMCYASCQLIYVYFLEKRSNRTLLITAGISLVLGYALRYFPVSVSSPFLYPFGIGETGNAAGDWCPIFPMLGWFLLGVVLARKFYGEKKSLWPEKRAICVTRPLQFLGRYSGIIYVAHIVIFPVVFFGLGALFRIL